MTSAKDLTKEAPRSPKSRLGGYAILARATDKGRADLAGNVGEYHYNCPLDNMLFSFKGITGEDFQSQIKAGATDDALIAWVNTNGTPKTAAEIKEWSDGMDAANPYENPEKRDWFAEQAKSVGLDPAKTTLFEWLETDDKVSFAK
jgi:hypothetical protein